MRGTSPYIKYTLDVFRMTKAGETERFLGYGILFRRHSDIQTEIKGIRVCVRALRALKTLTREFHRNFTMKSLCEIANALQSGREASRVHRILYFKIILCIINVFSSLFSALHSINMINVVTLALTSDFFYQDMKCQVILRNNFSYINENNNREIYSDMLSECGSELSITDTSAKQGGVIGRGRFFKSR